MIPHPKAQLRTAIHMNPLSIRMRRLALLACCAAAVMAPWPRLGARNTAAPPSVEALEQNLRSAKEESSAARQRLAVRRAIRDAESLLAARADTPQRFEVLELLFRARQQLIALDDDAEHRQDLLETCRELVKAPDEMASLRLEADLLLSQAEPMPPPARMPCVRLSSATSTRPKEPGSCAWPW